MSVDKPNLVFVFADQLRYQSLGYAGDERAHTPNIDRMASESTNFCNAVTSYPLCGPYRASLLTGKYASTTGMVTNELRMNPNHEFFGHVLNRNGYRTAYIGKWHLWANENEHREKHENQYVPPGEYRFGFDDYWAAYNFWLRFNEAFYYEDNPDQIEMAGYEPDVLTDLAIHYLQSRADAGEPFALFLSYGPPHDPWEWDNVPEEYASRFRDIDFPLPENYEDGSAFYFYPTFDREWWLRRIKPNLPRFQQVYYAMTANLDWNVGRLWDAIREAGISQDTIFVFTSDHGEMFGAHGRIQKLSFYEESCRVPFLLHWPGHIPAGRICDACLSTPDIMPTVLALMSLPIPEAVEGMDLSHLARGKPGPEPSAAFLQAMTGTHWLWDNGHEWRALRDKRYTYAVMHADGFEYLFHNPSDPLQMHNRAADPQYRLQLEVYRNMISYRMGELNDTFESATWYRDRWTQDRHVLRGAKG